MAIIAKRNSTDDRPSWHSASDEDRLYQKALQRQRKSRRKRGCTTWVTGLCAFVGTVLIGQLAVNEYRRIEARKTALAAIPVGKQWRGCAEVRAAGVAPLFKADPGYSDRLDADGDGIACEPGIGVNMHTVRWRLWQRL